MKKTLGILIAILLPLLLVGCFDDDKDKTEKGGLNQACLEGDLCNEGLVCLNDLCVTGGDEENGEEEIAETDEPVVDGDEETAPVDGDEETVPVDGDEEITEFPVDGDEEAAPEEEETEGETSEETPFCVPGCWNENCPGTYDLCLSEFGSCEEVPCSTHADCDGIEECDNPEGTADPHNFYCDDVVGKCRRGLES